MSDSTDWHQIHLWFPRKVEGVWHWREPVWRKFEYDRDSWFPTYRAIYRRMGQ